MNVHSETEGRMAQADKRTEIIHAAFELIAEQGFHGAPMAMVAKRAGVGAGTIYRYFENKDLLIGALHEELENSVGQAIFAEYDETKPIRERFVYLMKTLTHYFIENPRVFRFLEQFYKSPFGMAVRRDKYYHPQGETNVFQKLFEQGIAQQIVKDLPQPVLLAMVFGFLTQLIQDEIQGFIQVSEQVRLQVIEACWDALRR
jgi:AcrR family transcriptional regulator